MSTSSFAAAHTSYVKSLYRRMLKNELDWVVRRDIWRGRAMIIRAEFERNRDVHDPRALAEILQRAEAELTAKQHPDPYIAPSMPGGTKWERNIPPTIGPIYDHLAAGHH
ncbi:NDUFB9, NADH-ubiquinone oxidoreductase [Lanmaoa asiatica]|nr:NDUFB9, NADH-ubiquinone oxidoreductase [Lanmaoa asiatica]